MKRHSLLILCLLLSVQLYAQTNKTWEEDYEQMSQLEDAESQSWEENYDELSELAANPIDINTCTREALERLPFLSSQQVMDLLEYRDRVGRFQSVAELMLIPPSTGRHASSSPTLSRSMPSSGSPTSLPHRPLANMASTRWWRR